ncbi:UNVERIFIED_CONTAM: hypothetical protein Slati_1301300 [Sesamum latifolium]|uniref:Uncharacterized protein n=1 Tax=Sesamum latifolium TaxID=2727402 RepID=A0AAW2XGV4_9LAMI
MDRLRSLCDEINQLNTVMVGGNGDGCRAVAVKLDIASDGSAIEASVAKDWDIFGYIDVLINNAGVEVMTLELGGYNIRENSIAPGLFPSEISRAVFQHNLKTWAKKTIPLGTSGRRTQL